MLRMLRGNWYVRTGLAAVAALSVVNVPISKALPATPDDAPAWCPISESTPRSYDVPWNLWENTLVTFNGVKMKDGTQAASDQPASYSLDPYMPATVYLDEFYRWKGDNELQAGSVQYRCYTNILGQLRLEFVARHGKAYHIPGDQEPLAPDTIVHYFPGAAAEYTPVSWSSLADYCFIGHWKDDDTGEVWFTTMIYCVDHYGNVF